MRIARCLFFFFQAEDGIRDWHVTGVQTCALPIFAHQALIERAGELDEAVGERGFAVVDVGHDAEVADVVLAHRGERYKWPVSGVRCPVSGGRGPRSEERRVGQEGGGRWVREQPVE